VDAALNVTQATDRLLQQNLPQAAVSRCGKVCEPPFPRAKLEEVFDGEALEAQPRSLRGMRVLWLGCWCKRRSKNPSVRSPVPRLGCPGLIVHSRYIPNLPGPCGNVHSCTYKGAWRLRMYALGCQWSGRPR